MSALRGVIVGLGSIGRRHLRNLRQLRPYDHLTVIRRHDDGLAKLLGADQVCLALAECVSPAPDYAIIASPSTLHAESALKLAAAGTHLLVEKPLANSLPAANAIVEACRRNDRVLMTAYNLRFDEGLIRMRKAIRAGQIGKPLGFDAEVGQYLPSWRPDQDYRECVSARRELGGGALRELSHELDYMQWLLGPLSLASADLRKLSDLEIDVEDWAELQLRGASPDSVLHGHVHLDLLSHEPFRRCRVTGSKGTLTWNAITGETVLTTASERETLWRREGEDRNASYVRMLEHFLGRITKVGPRSHFEADNDASGTEALRLVEEAEQAAGDKPSASTPKHLPEKPRRWRRKPVCFAYVFARGGSKGLPGKNLRKLGGVSLLGHAIKRSLASDQIDDVIVSTDCADIAAEAIRHGAIVPGLRPKALATDSAPEWLAWQHAIEELSPQKPDIFVSVPPTAPLRKTCDIDACIQRLRETNSELVLTVASPYRNPYFNQVQVDRDDRCSLVMATPDVTRRQDAPPVFDITTVAYAADADAVLNRNGIFQCDVAYVEVPVQRSIDIDTPLDFEIAEALYRNAAQRESPMKILPIGRNAA
ncbi:MAG: Gfo/Idh/MocA family oxidoreductase [Planctomycetota bacterium]